MLSFILFSWLLQIGSIESESLETGNSAPSLTGRELKGFKNIPWLFLGNGKKGECERVNEDYLGSYQEFR